MLSDHPPDRIYNITFPASVWPDNTGDALVKIDGGFVGKTFKPFDF